MHKMLFVGESLLNGGPGKGYISLEDQGYVMESVELCRDRLTEVEEQPKRWRIVFANMMKAANLIYTDLMKKKALSTDREGKKIPYHGPAKETDMHETE